MHSSKLAPKLGGVRGILKFSIKRVVSENCKYALRAFHRTGRRGFCKGRLQPSFGRGVTRGTLLCCFSGSADTVSRRFAHSTGQGGVAVAKDVCNQAWAEAQRVESYYVVSLDNSLD